MWGPCFFSIEAEQDENRLFGPFSGREGEEGSLGSMSASLSSADRVCPSPKSLWRRISAIRNDVTWLLPTVDIVLCCLPRERRCNSNQGPSENQAETAPKTGCPEIRAAPLLLSQHEEAIQRRSTAASAQLIAVNSTLLTVRHAPCVSF